MDKLKIIKAIDYILKELKFKYNRDKKLYIDDSNLSYFDNELIKILVEEKCFQYQTKSNNIYYEGEYRCTDIDYWICDIDTLILFDYKRKLLGKNQKSIINIKTLERISRFIGDSGNADSIIEVLKECNVPDYLIIYPNTKWKMVYNILKVFSTSIYEDGHRLLFTVIENFLNPIGFNSIESGISTQKYFSDFLMYDGYNIVKGKIVPLEDKKDMYDIYYENKNGKLLNDNEFKELNDIISKNEYKRVTLLKGQDGKINFIEGERHFEREGNKYVDLEREFPFSDITASVHEGKTTKYIVNEKIKLKKKTE